MRWRSRRRLSAGMPRVCRVASPHDAPGRSITNRKRRQWGGAMQFGIFDQNDHGPYPLTEQYENRLQLIEFYDRAGFRTYHMSEHHSTPLNLTPSPSVFLAAVTQRTRRIRLGALVYVLPTHHPLRLAEEICMLDHLSGGRVEVGIGRGASPHELDYFGVDHDQAQAMYVEAYNVIM